VEEDANIMAQTPSEMRKFYTGRQCPHRTVMLKKKKKKKNNNNNNKNKKLD
jgi:hypothetical protein